MGAGILPTTIHNNKLYFLFGKENTYEDSASGFSDFGGGTDNKESFLETAAREGTEELTGFLGSEKDLKTRITKYGSYPITYHSEGHTPYKMFIIPFVYDDFLPYYYNNNQKFIRLKLDQSIIKNSKIFEKEEIRWFCIDDILKEKKHFRSYFQNIIEMIYEDKTKINNFIKKSSLFKRKKNKTLKSKK